MWRLLKIENLVLDSKGKNIPFKPKWKYHMNLPGKAIYINMSGFLEYIAGKIEHAEHSFQLSSSPFPSSPFWTIDHENWIWCIINKLLKYIPFKLENVDQLCHGSILFHSPILNYRWQNLNLVYCIVKKVLVKFVFSSTDSIKHSVNPTEGLLK